VLPVQQNDPRTIRAWAMYDWANSAYALVISSAIFPAYYNTITRKGENSRITLAGFDIENTALYSVALGLSFGLVAILSPLLSSISDYMGNQLAFMRFFCTLGALACMGLFFFTGPDTLWIGILGLMLSTIGYAGSIVYYNAYLPAIADEASQDKVSARGYAYGYLGATTLLIINLVFILNEKSLGITDPTLLPRLAFVSVGLWWIGFAQITFRHLPKGINQRKPEGRLLLHGYEELIKTWRQVRANPLMKRFLAGFFFYAMGVQTVMFMAASFGEKEIGLSLTALIATVFSLEYIAIGGAYLFAALSERWGNIRALILAVVMWIGICIGAYHITDATSFFICAFFIGIVMGGIQSLSRSTYAKLIPENGHNAGFFSFFDVSEKVAIMLGLLMFGTLDQLTGSMRNSIVALGIWFVVGLLFLGSVRKYQRQAGG
jgi:MFS transporter, UMF1 family